MSRLSKELRAFNMGRLPDMVRLKYQAMSENAFRFFRGTCHLFYQHLSKVKNLPRSPLAWICGDLHLENFGSYTADNKLVYFDLNDFDEALLAPALWEVLRLITSIFIAFDTLDIEADQGMNMAVLFVKTYAGTLCKAKAQSIEPRTAKGIVADFLTQADRGTYAEILEKRTEMINGKLMLSLNHNRHFKVDKVLKKQLKAHINDWIQRSSDGPYNFKVKDVVFRLAGTGSVGVKRYLFLMKSTNTKDHYLLLDMKQSFVSSLQPYVKAKQPKWDNQAQRIISVQQRMQNMSASMLSATIFKGEAYVIQELQPAKDTLEFKMIKDRYRDIYQVIDDMAVLTASSQLRCGGMDGSATIDELKAFGCKLDTWQKPVLDYALAYAARVKKDYAQFIRDYERGHADLN